MRLSELLNEEIDKPTQFMSGQSDTDVPVGYIRLYRGLTQEFKNDYDLSLTDAITGYSTWTDNKELARQYAGENGYVYQIDLPLKEQGDELINNDGDRVLFVNNEKKVGLNNISGNEYLIYVDHENYNPERIKLSEQENIKHDVLTTINLNENMNIDIDNITNQLLKDPSLVDYYSGNELDKALKKFKKEYPEYSRLKGNTDYIFFKNWVKKSYTPKIIKNIINRISNLQKNGYFNIYRVIEVEENWKPTNKLGVYWTYDENSAYPYDASFDKKNKQYMLYGQVNISSVNWPETIIVNIINPQEKELQIIKNEPIKLLKVINRDTNKEININSYVNKEYLA